MRRCAVIFIAFTGAFALACESPGVSGPVITPPKDTANDTTSTRPITPTDTATAAPVFIDGMAQIVPAFNNSSDWIRQELWVETEFDSDGDGRRDRMHVDVTRPKQTDTQKLKVPTVYVSSPYFAGIASSSNWNVQHEIGATPPTRAAAPQLGFTPSRPIISGLEVNNWVPRGFAVVHSEAPGTGLSQGCVQIGGDNEALAPKAVIQWLTGKAKGYKTADGNDTVAATWSTGKVGMTGASYNGTLAVAAATTGVAGLEAIIPASPVVSWYMYYRNNGLVRSPGGYLGEDTDVLYDAVNSGDPARRANCDARVRDNVLTPGEDRITGDYNAFWAARDMFEKVANIKAATLIASGFGDFNVMPEHGVLLYEMLRAQHTPAMSYFHQGGHGTMPPIETRVRWFTRYLYGVNNGVENGAVAYPDPASQPVTMHLQAGGNAIGTFTLGAASNVTESFTDSALINPSLLYQAASSNNRLMYATSPLTQSVHLSGWTSVTLRVASSKAAANLSVYLVSLPATSLNPASVVTRGWADPQNSSALTGVKRFVSQVSGTPLVPGQFYNVTFYLQPDDQVIAAGSRLAVMIFSSDQGYTLWPSAGTRLSVDLAASSVTLPVVGGASAIQ